MDPKKFMISYNDPKFIKKSLLKSVSSIFCQSRNVASEKSLGKICIYCNKTEKFRPDQSLLSVELLYLIKTSVNPNAQLMTSQTAFMMTRVFLHHYQRFFFCFSGDIGGSMGLFCGMSLITICEFVDFVCAVLFQKCNG